MANLKRSAIELVTGVDGENVQTKVFYTSPFIPFSVTYEAVDLMEEMDKNPNKLTEKERVDKALVFIADKVYGGQFTREELLNGLHGPEAMAKLREQIMFVAGGEVSGETKKLLAKKA